MSPELTIAFALAEMDSILIGLIQQTEVAIRRLPFFEHLGLQKELKTELSECSIDARQELVICGEHRHRLLVSPADPKQFDLANEVYFGVSNIAKRLSPHVRFLLQECEDDFHEDDLTDEFGKKCFIEFRTGLKQSVEIVDSAVVRLRQINEQFQAS